MSLATPQKICPATSPRDYNKDLLHGFRKSRPVHLPHFTRLQKKKGCDLFTSTCCTKARTLAGHARKRSVQPAQHASQLPAKLKHCNALSVGNPLANWGSYRHTHAAARPRMEAQTCHALTILLTSHHPGWAGQRMAFTIWVP